MCLSMDMWRHIFCLHVFVLCTIHYVLFTDASEGCSGRIVLNQKNGFISDGDGNYPASAHCQWLIDGNGSTYITLEFQSMKTECSYDYLFVYDGNSYGDKLLGSFSGFTLPDTVIATSGYMLIYFYSDRNYVLDGFEATYYLSDCLYNCSGHGRCDPSTKTCSCDLDYFGDGCQYSGCAGSCYENGLCLASGYTCRCNNGFIGDQCQVAVNDTRSQSTWNTVVAENEDFTPRTGHTGVYVPSVNGFYIFGGNTLSTLLDDLIKFDFSPDYHGWRTLPKTSPWPAGRHEHAMVRVGENFYIYGGILSNGSHSNELWFYKISNNRWFLKGTSGSVTPPGLASHTLTLVENKWLYLFGGRTEHGDFSSAMYRIDVERDDEWETVQVRGGKEADRRLVGHSTVYHKESKSLLVFGGFLPDYARFPKRMNYLHTYHIEENYWSQIFYEAVQDYPPKDRSYHTATIMDNYMVVFGGNSHIHHEEEICYDNDIYFYHLGCHRWVNYKKMAEAFPGQISDSEPGKGRFSHVADLAYGNTLLIVGGYRGNVLGDIISYTVPKSIAKNWNDSAYTESKDICEEYGKYEYCKYDPECVWCMEKPDTGEPGCLHRNRLHECTGGSTREGNCPGLCASLHDCGSCTVQGQGADLTDSNNIDLFHNEKCAWCVKEGKCQKLSVPQGVCSPLEGTHSGLEGWWGVNSSRPSSLDKCRLEDYPAGLHWIKYRYPPDWEHPDEVEIITTTSENFQFDPLFDAENIDGTEYTAKFQGYIHPLDAPSSNGDPLKVFLVSVAAHAWLYISTDDSPENKQLVAELDIITYESKKAIRPGFGDRVFPDSSRGHKYYIEQIAVQDIAGRSATPIAATMQLEWTGALKIPSRIRETFTSEFLEPYSSGVCSHYSSCLACMTDTSCGWCVTSFSCVAKTDVELPAGQCGAVNGARHVVINAVDCPICADHITCQTCTQDSLCEWLTPEARCLRRGRFPESINNTAQCPVSCQERNNCSSCLSERNECAWCEQTNTCFPFVEYMMRYVYGKCTQWLDNMGKSPQCHDCSRHVNCKDCLADFQCGWCGNDDNPTLGRCLHGDFTGPAINETCSAHIAGEYNISSTEPASWSYGQCPDVEECRLELHDCHENATCHNTFESYMCECNRGFTGNGKDTCNRTCYYDCINGICSEAPKFECNCTVGWTGVDCNTNCGCNNHSTCVTGLGVCDECEHWTTGEHCEFCKAGAFGDATSESGCIECDCNDHGDDSMGYCNSTTGVCFCKDNTEGDHCEDCIDGYYGDPWNGDRCYLKCEGRTILGNIKQGALGTHAGQGVTNKAHAYCLWILTVHPDLTNLRLINVVPTITFNMQTDIKTKCSRDYVYVYDGIPSFMTSSSSSSATLLAAFCGFGLEAPLSVEAKSGYLTVYFEGNIEPSSSSTRGFNATYHVNTCPTECFGNRKCVGDKCVCIDGWGGIDCQLELCPKNCSFNMGQGICDKEAGWCSCSHGYSGTDCSRVITPEITYYTRLFDPWRSEGFLAFNSSLARMGHSLVTCDGNTFYMFGGYSLSQGALNDMWKFEVATDSWTLLLPATNDEPGPRYQHAAVCVPTIRGMFVYGGINSEGIALREMWKFSLDSNRWSKLAIEDPVEDYPIPSMSGHTLTLIDDTKLWLIGGFSSPDYFSETVYQYDISDNTWAEMAISGSTPTGLYGHSAVYHEDSDTIYVFGGFEYLTDKTIPSANLYGLDIRRKIWSLLSPEESNKQSERYFHTAVTTDEYMVVLGGRTSQKDYDNSVLAYRYNCNHWIDLTAGETYVLGDGIPSVIGPAAIAKTNENSSSQNIYFMAGFNGMSQAVMTKVTIPNDLCQLIVTKDVCVATLGCAACIDEATNKTYCYSNEDPARFDCAHGTQWNYFGGTACNIERIQERDCGQHATCTECLAQWPVHRGHARVCQWCSNCPTGKCIPKNDDCDQANYCRRQQRAITSADDCVERLCQASDCIKCSRKTTCIWTRQFKRSSEVGRTLSLIPIYDWNCVVKSLLDATPYLIESSPPNTCPMRCYQYTTCKACLNSLGGEGGAQECVWSVHLQECMPPAYLELHCSNGECGHILSGQADQCPENCSIHTQCSRCLSTPGCGWCAFGGLNGKGVCMEGGLTGPKDGLCTAANVTNGTQPLSRDVAEDFALSTEPPSWSFGKCPPENECENDHHTCDDSENCTNLEVGFRCDCKTGYVRDKNHKCKPDCKQRCEPHGDCVAPDVCQCHFGYVGDNCTTECHCNKHSNCESVARRDKCLDCKNNTQGSQCQECKPLYVGNPIDGGRCQSCTSFCNQHSEICISKENYQINNYNSLINPNLQLQGSSEGGNVTVRPTGPGPQDAENAICLHCSGNTEGEQCEKCREGFFREPKETIIDECRPCQCHGHSKVCDEDGGKNCDCKNNTKSPRCDTTQEATTHCWELQCSECMDNFMGKPTDGHQCYRQMTVDRDYCFDPNTQMKCHSDPAPLHKGRTVFFVVQPKYLNVDIRIMLDVTKGGVDVYFTSFDDTYKIDVDEVTGIHDLNIDPKYKYEPVNSEGSLRGTRSVDNSGSGFNNNTDTERVYMYETQHAVDFNSFVTLLYPDTFLQIKNVRNRLVITLPNHIHRLKITRFYIVLRGVGSSSHNETYGNIFFRQDQPHIDLFVFFSVFFSNFFLFLAICVMLWKLKQAVDARQSRQRRQQEMQHMASRPFAKVDIIIEPDLPEMCPPPDNIVSNGTVPQLAKKGAQPIPKLSSKYSLNSNSNDVTSPDEKYYPRPIALEPTDDGVAAIGTVIIQLPGGACAPVRSCLGSTIVQGSRVLLNTVPQQPKTSVYIRRRPSTSA